MNVLTDPVPGDKDQPEHHNVTNASILDSSGLQGCDTAELAECSQHLKQIYYVNFKGMRGPWKNFFLDLMNPNNKGSIFPQRNYLSCDTA
jgi:hypothetical protein